MAIKEVNKMTLGRCPHGTFELTEGCTRCIADRMAAEGNTPEMMKEAIAKVNPNIVKVRYFSETTGEESSREYTYFSADRLNVGDIVIVPARDTTGKARVSTIDVPESEIAAFKDKVKTIPAGSVIIDKTIMDRDRHYGLVPEPLSDEARAILTGGRDKMIEAATTSISLRPGADAEVMDYHNEAVRLKAYAEGRLIQTVEDVKAATDDLGIISKLKKVMESKRKQLLDPLEAQKKAIRETYDYLMSPILEADSITRKKMLAYDAEQRRIRVEQEQINALRLEAAQKDAALHNGEISESVNLVEVQPEPAKSTATEMGSSSVRENWKFEVVDQLAVPREYLVVDTAMLTMIAKKYHDNKLVKGVRFYNEPIISVRVK